MPVLKKYSSLNVKPGGKHLEETKTKERERPVLLEQRGCSCPEVRLRLLQLRAESSLWIVPLTDGGGGSSKSCCSGWTLDQEGGLVCETGVIKSLKARCESGEVRDVLPISGTWHSSPAERWACHPCQLRRNKEAPEHRGTPVRQDEDGYAPGSRCQAL